VGEDQREIDAEVEASSAAARDQADEWQRLLNREDVNDERGLRLSVREADQVRGQLAAGRRDQVADERDRTADRRDQLADERDQAADERDRLSDVRDSVADQREIDAETEPGRPSSGET
jgi:hypothetical protein